MCIVAVDNWEIRLPAAHGELMFKKMQSVPVKRAGSKYHNMSSTSKARVKQWYHATGTTPTTPVYLRHGIAFRVLL